MITVRRSVCRYDDPESPLPASDARKLKYSEVAENFFQSEN